MSVVPALTTLALEWRGIADGLRNFSQGPNVSKTSVIDATGRAHAYDKAASDLLKFCDKLASPVDGEE